MHSSFMTLRSYDKRTNPEALGISFGDGVVAIALVSKVGPSNLWLYVREGSGALDHVPNFRELRDHIAFFGSAFNFERALTAIQAELGVDEVGTDNTEDKRGLAWQWASHTLSFIGRLAIEAGKPKSLASLGYYFWKSAERVSDSSLKSSEDLTVVHAVLNGLVILGVADEEAASQLRISREERLQDGIRNGGSVQSDWPWVEWKGKRQRVPPEVARELSEMGSAKYL